MLVFAGIWSNKSPLKFHVYSVNLKLTIGNRWYLHKSIAKYQYLVFENNKEMFVRLQYFLYYEFNTEKKGTEVY